MNTSHAIPIVLVSGFLGAGKTTLMRRLIAAARERGLRACVIVNEFGAADVDGSILKQADAELLSSVAGGCACCSGQEDFLWTLLDVAERDVADPTRPDVILVECSGLADPLLMLDSITVARLLPLVRLGALLTVADVGGFESARRQVMPLLIRQLQLADIVVLNKIDLARENPKASIEELAQQLREVAPHALVLPAREAEIDFGLLWPRIEQADSRAAATSAADDESEAKGSAHAHYRTVACPLPHPVEESWLREELGKLGPGVWRAKGFVRLRGQAALHLVQVTGGSSGPRVEVRPFAIFEPGMGADEPPTSLVFIGPSLDRAGLLRSFGSVGMLPMI